MNSKALVPYINLTFNILIERNSHIELAQVHKILFVRLILAFFLLSNTFSLYKIQKKRKKS